MLSRKHSVGDQSGWTDERWLSWYLDNHSLKDLIPLNLWKKNTYIRTDVLGVDGAVEAIRAAYMLDGEQGAIAVLAGALQSLLPPDAYVPELPPEWRDRRRFYNERYKDPATRPKFFGVFRGDR